MTDDPKVLDSPDKIAEEGQRLYEERHKLDLEQNHRGEYVAIDVLTGNAYIGRFPELALEEARRQAPNGVFHLIRIGAPGAFKVSFGSRHGLLGLVTSTASVTRVSSSIFVASFTKSLGLSLKASSIPVLPASFNSH